MLHYKHYAVRSLVLLLIMTRESTGHSPVFTITPWLRSKLK